MRIRLQSQYLNYADIRQLANAFLGRFRSRLGPPVQIDEIAEIDLGIEIIPISGLMEDFDIDGFTSSDLRSIFIDESIFNQTNESRYRFTIAHELGHLAMHKEIFARFSFNDIAEYTRFIREVDEEDRGWLEYQAYCFAGLVLVPSAPLKELFEKELSSKTLKQKIQTAQEHGLCREDYLDRLKIQIAERLARHFNVSPQVVARRLDYDFLNEKIP